jgi:hypothetical protein
MSEETTPSQKALLSSGWAASGFGAALVVVLLGVLLAAWSPFLLIVPLLLGVLLLALVGAGLVASVSDGDDRIQHRWEGAYEDPDGLHARRTGGMISDRHRGH